MTIIKRFNQLYSPSFFYTITWWALLLITGLVFISISASALHHLLLLLLTPFIFYWGYQKSWWREIPKSGWALVVLIFIGLISNLYNWDDLLKTGQWGKSFSPIKYFFFALMALISYQQLFLHKISEKKIKFLIHLFLITTTIATLSGIMALYTGWNPLRFKEACHPTRTCGLYGMYMSYGYGIQFFMLIITGLLLFYRRIKEAIRPSFLFLLFCWLINGVGFSLSGARGGFLGFFLSLPLFFIRTHRKIFFYSSALLLLLALIFQAPLSHLFFAANRVQSQSARVVLFKTGFEAFKQNPLLGLGMRNFEPHAIAIQKSLGIQENDFFQGHGHNNFIEYLATTGIIGFLALLFFHLFWFWEAYRRKDLLGDMVVPIISALFISGQMQYTMGDAANMFLLMNIFALSHIKYSFPNHHEVHNG